MGVETIRLPNKTNLLHSLDKRTIQSVTELAAYGNMALANFTIRIHAGEFTVGVWEFGDSPYYLSTGIFILELVFSWGLASPLITGKKEKLTIPMTLILAHWLARSVLDYRILHEATIFDWLPLLALLGMLLLLLTTTGFFETTTPFVWFCVGAAMLTAAVFVWYYLETGHLQLGVFCRSILCYAMLCGAVLAMGDVRGRFTGEPLPGGFFGIEQISMGNEMKGENEKDEQLDN